MLRMMVVASGFWCGLQLFDMCWWVAIILLYFYFLAGFACEHCLVGCGCCYLLLFCYFAYFWLL